MSAAEGNKLRFTYVLDEGSLSRRLGFEIQHPIRLFGLEGLGVDQDRFLHDLAAAFSMLAWDEYDVKRAQVAFLVRQFPDEKKRLDSFLVDYFSGAASLRVVGDLIVNLPQVERWELESIAPRRKRSIARFLLDRSKGDSWHADRLAAGSFAQTAQAEAGAYRALSRVFEETSELVTGHPDFQQLLVSLAQMVEEVRPSVTRLAVTAHQVSIFANAEHEGDNSPEGIHQDGADYIVSALVVERDGILGGESVVYGSDKTTEYLRATLQPGQGLFQADRNTTLWHDVTPIHDDPATPPTYGKRSIFGFDIDVLQ